MNNLQNYKLLYENADGARDLARDLFLKEAFKDRTEYALPLWLVQNLQNAGELLNAWGVYRHDGAFIGIGKVKALKGEFSTSYLISGYEDMEYSSDYMEDVETYDEDVIAKFILQWLNDDMDSKLEKLAAELKDLTEEDEDLIFSKTEDLLSSDSDIDVSEVLEWAKGFLAETKEKGNGKKSVASHLESLRADVVDGIITVLNRHRDDKLDISDCGSTPIIFEDSTDGNNSFTLNDIFLTEDGKDFEVDASSCCSNWSGKSADLSIDILAGILDFLENSENFIFPETE